jgi:hypothetical protein
MKEILLYAFSILLSLSSYSQNTSCNTAIPYSLIDNNCIFFSPLQSFQRCYGFNSPSDSIDFTFDYFASSGNPCTNPLVQYTLFDSDCQLDSSNSDGFFVNLIPGEDYVICYSVGCESGIVGVVCAIEEIVLPIELINFSYLASLYSIKLIWNTATEFNCAGFGIYRSTDASNWKNIGFVSGAGNSQQIQSYSFEDSNPVEGVSYYRLIQFDLNGDFEYLPVIAATWNPKMAIDPFIQYNYIGQRIRNSR